MRRQNQQPQNNSLHPPTSGIWSSLKCISRCHGPAIHTKQKLCDNYAKLCDHCQMSKLFPLAPAPTGFEFVSFCTYIKTTFQHLLTTTPPWQVGHHQTDTRVQVFSRSHFHKLAISNGKQRDDRIMLLTLLSVLLSRPCPLSRQVSNLCVLTHSPVRLYKIIPKVKNRRKRVALKTGHGSYL